MSRNSIEPFDFIINTVGKEFCEISTIVFEMPRKISFRNFLFVFSKFRNV